MTTRPASLNVNRLLMAALMFIASYMITITVNAQQPAADAIQLNENDVTVITGTVKSAEENFVIIDSAGKEMKIVLDKVDMNGPADTLFSPGMQVTVDGRMTGNDFGLPLVTARSITATESPPVRATP